MLLPESIASKNPNKRIKAIKQIVADGKTGAIGKLVSMAKEDPHRKVRQQACWAIGELGTAAERPALEDVIASDRNSKVKHEAEIALKKLAEKQ